MAYNLLPKEYRPRKPMYVVYLVVIIYSLTLIYMGTFMYNVNAKYSVQKKQNDTKQKELTVLQSKSQDLKNTYTKLKETLENDEEYKSKLKLEEDYKNILSAYAFNYADFLQKLGTITPVQVGVQAITSEGNNIIIEVDAKTINYVEIFKKNLETLQLFSSVTYEIPGQQNAASTTTGQQTQVAKIVQSGNRYKVICTK